MRIFIFGDSIAQGFWDTQGGWVQRLTNQYHQESLGRMLADEDDYVVVFNLGISGDTARGVLKRMKYEVRSRRLSPDEDMIVIAIGLNDTMIYKGVDTTPAGLFRDELEELLESAQELTDKILFVGLTAVEDEACSPWKYSSSGKCFANNRIREFDTVIADFCEAHGVPFVKIHQPFQKQMGRKQLLADGLHPNDAGHELITELVKPALDELLN
jgi:lysophospholipase L1-like esterase